MHNVKIQYVTDEEGNKKAVMIPIEEWKKVEKQFLELAEYASLDSDLRAAFMEVQEMMKGNKKGQTLKEFLDEC
jgi:hypothetical protein